MYRKYSKNRESDKIFYCFWQLRWVSSDKMINPHTTPVRKPRKMREMPLRGVIHKCLIICMLICLARM